ncbi:MAG: hypothetical protein K9L95_05165 [Candidatus Omnitrophica bacterium]|nr:hypothetical protein [Candidatus Omnitrophota bacterium]MCF7892818.1 hypothetical protein [Candidatus Omnitrophota bacterium]
MSKLSKFEKMVFLGSPWFFGVALIASGLYSSYKTGNSLINFIIILSGLICICFYCIAALLAKLIEK